jgi:hypothetical protein
MHSVSQGLEISPKVTLARRNVHQLLVSTSGLYVLLVTTCTYVLKLTRQCIVDMCDFNFNCLTPGLQTSMGIE